jgi:hypothetical protein
MSKEIKNNREDKKKPLMTAKEKKAAKRAKKLNKNTIALFEQHV